MLCGLISGGHNMGSKIIVGLERVKIFIYKFLILSEEQQGQGNSGKHYGPLASCFLLGLCND